MKKIEKMFQVGGKISGRSGYRKHNIFFATPYIVLYNLV